MTLRFTPRDQRLLDTLSEFHLLSTSQITKLIFSNVHQSAIHRRLRKLEKSRLVERLARAESQEWVWCLGLEGRAKYGHKKVKVNKNSLGHDLKCNEVRIKLEQLGLARHFRASFMLREKVSTSISPRDRSLDQIPDWICSMSFNSGKRTTSIEVELNYKGKRRMQKVIETYSAKDEIEKIVYFVSSLSMGKKMLEIVKEYEYKKGKTWFMFITIADFLIYGLDSHVYFLGGKIRLKQTSPVLADVYGQDRRIQNKGG